MSRTRIILFLSAALLVVLMFSLPRVVVDNKENVIDEATTSTPNNTSSVEQHDATIDYGTEITLNRLKEKLVVAENNQKSITFADSLANLYLSVNKYDSAAKFFEIIAGLYPNVTNWLKAGNTYYEAYGFAMDKSKQMNMGEKSRYYFHKVLAEDADNLEVKNKIAMTYLSTSNPMQGIMMLREIIEIDPKNEQAMFNLGVLSMQTGQYDNAIERFSTLVAYYPNHTQAQFFLGVCYKETGNKDKAKEQFNLVKSLDDDPSVQATADNYLEELE